MKADSKRVVALTVLVLVASGCASNTNNSESQSTISPISVNSFQALPNPVPGAQTTSLSMELENTGDATAQDIAVRILGPTFGESGDAVWKSAGGDEDMSRKGPRTKSIDELRAPSENNPSIPKQVRWSLEAPNVDEDRNPDYDFNAQIFYNYETTASTDFKLVSNDRFNEQGLTQTDATADNSNGPVQIDIRGTTPKIYYEGEDISSEICITVTNSGPGKVFKGGKVDAAREYNMNQAEEDVIDLSIQDVGNVEFTPVEDTGGEIELIGGNEGYKCYNMEASGLTSAEQNINTQITASYNYMKETATTSVTVEGRRGRNVDEENQEESSGDTEYSWEDGTPTNIKNGNDPQSYCTDEDQPEDLRNDYCEPNP